MEKYGFVYIWFDRKHKRYYIGCHWGNINDGYICSSNWMRDAYNRRPEDFKRRILTNNINDRSLLLEIEYRWLQLIKDEELKKKYYNLSKKHFGHWTTNEENKKTIGQKISESHNNDSNWGQWSKDKKFTEEHKQKLSNAKKGKPSPRKGIIMSNEQKLKISLSKKGKKTKFKHTEESKENLRIKHLGKKHSEETKKKISKNRKGISPNRSYEVSQEVRNKISISVKKYFENKSIKG